MPEKTNSSSKETKKAKVEKENKVVNQKNITTKPNTAKKATTKKVVKRSESKTTSKKTSQSKKVTTKSESKTTTKKTQNKKVTSNTNNMKNSNTSNLSAPKKNTTSNMKQTNKKVNSENKNVTKKIVSKESETKNIDKKEPIEAKKQTIDVETKEKITTDNKILKVENKKVEIDYEVKENKSQTNDEKNVNILDKGQDILDDLYSNYEKINAQNNESLSRSNKNKIENTKTSKNKKRRLKKSRVLLVVIVFILIIFLINFIKSSIYNNTIYNDISKSKSDIAILKSKNNTIDLYEKTINYIKKNKKQVQIKNNDITVYMDVKNFKNNLDLDFSIYNKKIKNETFDNSKVLYIDSNSVIENSNKIKIKLPKYLYKNNVVDIYGVDKNGNIDVIEKKKEIKNKHITFNITKKYVKYFIAYIKVSDIKVLETVEVEKNNVVNLKIEYLPTTATEKEIEYNNIGDNFMLRNDEIIAKNVGEYTIKLKVKNSKIEKDIKIIIQDSKPKIEIRDGVTYIDGTIIVNKTYSLPKDYNPGSLKEEVLSAYEKMKEAAKKDNINLWIASGFRSYNTQDELYNYYVETDGIAKADTYSARPGHSEHQTGLAMDLNIVNSSFEGTPEAIWLEKNSYKYGFIIRYPKGKENITGYKYEPWHIRYLGEDLSKKVYESGLTLEEYYNIKSEYSTN